MHSKIKITMESVIRIDRNFYHTEEMYEDACCRFAVGEVVKRVEIVGPPNFLKLWGDDIPKPDKLLNYIIKNC